MDTKNTKSYKEYLNQITTLIFDVDGVLTDGTILVTEKGELLRSMNVKDGYALKQALNQGFNICIISGGTSEGVRTRLKGLGISDVFLGAHHKTEQLQTYLKANNIKKHEVLYVGDDIPDVPVLKQVGLACCPQDAVPEVKNVCNYISHKNGGKGCVREIIEQVLKVHDKWDAQFDASAH